MAVRKAVSAATTTFTAISMIRFFISHRILLFHTDFTDYTDFFTLALLMSSARCSLGPDPNVISLISQRGLSPSVLRLYGLSRSSVRLHRHHR